MTTLTRTAGAAGTISLTTKNSAGQLITPVSVPTASWYTDAGRTAGATTLTVTGSGSTYTATFSAPQAPATPSTRYLKFSVEVSAGVFDVDATSDVSFVDAVVEVGSQVVTADELNAQLNIPASSRTAERDAELLDYAARYLPVIEEWIGSPVLPTTVTERAVVSGGVLILRKSRAVSLTSIVDAYGVALTGGVLDADTGLVHFDYGTTYTSNGPVTVTYEAGFAVGP